MSVVELDVLFGPSFERHRLLFTYMTISAAAILIYDYFLTLQLEIKFIWFSRWRYTEVLFLLLRYLPFVGIVLLIHDRLFHNVSVGTCMVTFPLKIWLWVFIMILGELILAIRTWAMWCRNRFVGIGLATLSIANLVIQCISTERLIRSNNYSSPPYLGFTGCLMISNDKSSWISFASFVMVEAIVLLLVAVSAFRTYRQGYKTELAHVIHRDGIMIYIYLLGITTANIIMIAIVSLDIQLLLTPLQGVLYSVLTIRIILNIRNVGIRDLEIALHTSYHDSYSFGMPLPFIAADSEHTELHTTQSQSLGRLQDDNCDESVS